MTFKRFMPLLVGLTAILACSCMCCDEPELELIRLRNETNETVEVTMTGLDRAVVCKPHQHQTIVMEYELGYLTGQTDTIRLPDDWRQVITYWVEKTEPIVTVGRDTLHAETLLNENNYIINFFESGRGYYLPITLYIGEDKFKQGAH